jgi:hypothetical protein
MRYLIASPVESWLITCTSSRVDEVGECDHVAIRPSWLVVLAVETDQRMFHIGSSECAICSWTLGHCGSGIMSSTIASP